MSGEEYGSGLWWENQGEAWDGSSEGLAPAEVRLANRVRDFVGTSSAVLSGPDRAHEEPYASVTRYLLEQVGEFRDQLGQLGEGPARRYRAGQVAAYEDALRVLCSALERIGG